jgi:threonine dehydrogenase-like Zn-dependent dehydrogenase
LLQLVEVLPSYFLASLKDRTHARMIAAIYTQDGEFAVTETAIPETGPGDLRLRVTATSICGSDLKIIRHGHRKLAAGQSIVLGHEFAGVIDQVGSGVTGFAEGMRVGVAPNAGCGRCDMCLAGKSNYCPDYTALGIDRDGAHATHVLIPARFVTQGNVVLLPDAVRDAEASLLEPCSCVVNAVRGASVGLGDSVVIYGAGPMGLLHVMLCRLAGAAQVIAVDPVSDRLTRARALGCDLLINPLVQDVRQHVQAATEGRGAQVVITACPVAAVQTEAVTLLAPFGRLCLFGGLPKGHAGVPLETNLIHYKNLYVTGSTGGSIADYQLALRLVQSRRLELESLVSDRFALDELQAGYHTAVAGTVGKVVFLHDA